jgi:hypothetical protein
VEELLKGRDVEDLVAGGLRSVDHELFDYRISNCFLVLSKLKNQPCS